MAELERKVGQLTMEIDLLKKGAQLGRQPNEGSYSIVTCQRLAIAVLAWPFYEKTDAELYLNFATSPDHLTDNTGAKF